MSLLDALRKLLGRARSAAPAPERSEMISCEEALSAVYEYLDGELEPGPVEKVRAHFDACSRCYPHLKLEESFRAALQGASASQATPPDLKERVLDLLSRSGET